MQNPCKQCPWRTENQGEASPGGFYTKANLTRLWGQIRRGGHAQSCHLTDPSHPDHLLAGCKPDSKPQECPGSVILVKRELAIMASFSPDQRTIDDAGVKAYLKLRRGGLTKFGILYWLVDRVTFGGQPFIGGPALPETADDPAIGLPKHLCPKPTQQLPGATSPRSTKNQGE